MVPMVPMLGGAMGMPYNYMAQTESQNDIDSDYE